MFNSKSLLSVALVVATCAQAAADPGIKLVRKGGLPFIEIDATITACPDIGIQTGTRQQILNVAAMEWAAFEFPRLSLNNKISFRIIPDSLSPNIAATRGGGVAANLLNVGAMEDDSHVRERIGNYWAALPEAYRAVFEVQNVLWQRSGGRAGWAEYWSAAFISYVMCMSGLKPGEFTRAEAHRDYIRAAIDARKSPGGEYRFHAYDVAEIRPSPGDIICAARDDGTRSINTVDDFNRNAAHGSYHCDIVVGFDNVNPRKVPGVVFSIGGNVLNAVTMTQTPLRNGKLLPVKTPRARNWFVVLKVIAPAEASFRKVPASVIDAARQLQQGRLRR